MIRLGMILNEPPLPQLSAATRSSAAMVRAFHALEDPKNFKLEKVVACASNIAEQLRQVEDIFPDHVSKIMLLPNNTGNRLISRLRSLAWPMSNSVGSLVKSEIQRLFANHEIDLLHIEQLWSAYAVADSVARDRVLVNPHFFLKTDMLTAEPPVGLGDAIFRNNLVQAELKLLRKFRHIRVLSNEMATTLAEIHPRAVIHIVPLPIDPAGYTFRLRDQIPSSPVVTCIGSMFWPPSRAAARRLLTRLWPEIHRLLPKARLQVVGRDAMRYFQTFDGIQNTTIHENVPQIEPFFLEPSLLLYAPPEGSGMKVKVQEAMLHGLPVVTNHSGAEGLALVDGRDALLAESDDDLVAAAVRLLGDPALSRRLSQHGRQVVLDQCGPHCVVQQLCTIYETMMAQ